MIRRTDKPAMTDEALVQEADAWVLRLTSGAATRKDAAAARAWRDADPAHEQAFRQAVRLRGLVREAARTDAHRSHVGRPRSPGLDRRTILRGAIAASGVGGAILIGGQAAHLWSEASEADFSTAKGERRNLRLGAGVSVEMNTLTRLALRPDAGANGLEVLGGEAMLDAALSMAAEPLVVLAGRGRALARRARFNLRCDGDDVQITCLAGEVEVRLGDGRYTVPAAHRLTYSGETAGGVGPVDPDAVEAWRRGVLIFRQERLGVVVAEINRYRPGRIVLANPVLADRRIDGVFYARQLDQVIDQVRSAFGARITRLPAGVVVLS